MTTLSEVKASKKPCPIEALWKMLSAKWRLEIFRMAVSGPLRFNSLLREIQGSNKQSLSAALKGLEAEGLLQRVTVSEKPLHVEYSLTAKGHSLIAVFKELERFNAAEDL